MKTISPKNAKYAATVENVKELRLTGNANLEFWNKHFADKPFQVFDNQGFAEITISATELVWKGFRYNELTITLALAEKDNPHKQVGVFMLHAFNTNRFFAFCERAFFSTPYYFGRINLQETGLFSMNASGHKQVLFTAEMSETERPINEVNDNWEGAVFLKKEKYFIAKLLGETKVYPFLESDKIILKSDAKHSVFEQLINSGFMAKEWRWRADAFHAKSKTYSIPRK